MARPPKKLSRFAAALVLPKVNENEGIILQQLYHESHNVIHAAREDHNCWFSCLFGYGASQC